LSYENEIKYRRKLGQEETISLEKKGLVAYEERKYLKQKDSRKE